MTGFVTVVCDSPKHARGKVAKLALYMVADDGEVKRDLTYLDKRMERTKDIASAATALNHRMLDFALNGTVPAPQCKLCGGKIPDNTTLVDAAIRALVVDGQFTTTSLSVLRSTLRRQERH